VCRVLPASPMITRVPISNTLSLSGVRWSGGLPFACHDRKCCFSEQVAEQSVDGWDVFVLKRVCGSRCRRCACAIVLVLRGVLWRVWEPGSAGILGRLRGRIRCTIQSDSHTRPHFHESKLYAHFARHFRHHKDRTPSRDNRDWLDTPRATSRSSPMVA
jgi:hypothetical protein